jgi:hypothetical protein
MAADVLYVTPLYAELRAAGGAGVPPVPAAAAVVVREVDGSPAVTPTVIEVSNGTLSVPAAGVARIATGGGGGSPGGSVGQVQFNDGGSFGGDTGLTYDKAADALTVGRSVRLTPTAITNAHGTGSEQSAAFDDGGPENTFRLNFLAARGNFFGEATANVICDLTVGVAIAACGGANTANFYIPPAGNLIQLLAPGIEVQGNSVKFIVQGNTFSWPGTDAAGVLVSDGAGTLSFSTDGSGLTGLNASNLATGTVPVGRLPAVAISEFLGAVASQAAMLALVGQRGDWCHRTDQTKTYILVADDPTLLASWKEVLTPAGAAWGTVTGTLSDQTDLQSALTARALLAGGNAFTGGQVVSTGANGTVGLKVAAAAGQTANLAEWQNAAGDVRAWVNPKGGYVVRPAAAGDLGEGFSLHRPGDNVRVFTMGLTASSEPVIDTNGTALNVTASLARMPTIQTGRVEAVGVTSGIDVASGSNPVTVTCGNAAHVPFRVRAATSQTAALQTWTDQSGAVLASITAGGVLQFAQIAALPTAATNSALIGAKDVAGTAEIFVKDEAGTETQISPHSQRGPGALYDDVDPLPHVIEEHNEYIGGVRYLNVSRACYLLEELLEAIEQGRTLAQIRTALTAKGPGFIDTYRTETYAEHNTRLGLTGTPAEKIKRNWAADQSAKQAAYDAARAAELADRAAYDATPEADRVGPPPPVRPALDVRKPKPAWLAARGG